MDKYLQILNKFKWFDYGLIFHMQIDGAKLGFDKPNCIFKLLVMILTLKPPSIKTSSMKFLPT